MGLMPAQTAYDVPQPAERGPKPHDTGHHSPAPKTTGPARPVAFAHLAAASLVPSRGSRGGETPYRALVSLSCADVGVGVFPAPDAALQLQTRVQITVDSALCSGSGHHRTRLDRRDISPTPRPNIRPRPHVLAQLGSPRKLQRARAPLQSMGMVRA
jgi:hypothetical protein